MVAAPSFFASSISSRSHARHLPRVFRGRSEQTIAIFGFDSLENLFSIKFVNIIRALALICFVIAPASAIQAQTIEILGKTATFKKTSDLDVLVSNNRAASIMVKRSPLSGSLILSGGTGANAKYDFGQLIIAYKTARVNIISSALRGNTFNMELRTGTRGHDLRRIVSAVYVPQEPGMPQKVFTSILDIPNMSWNSNGAKSLRAAMQSFRPKSLAFRDTQAPSLFVADPPRPMVTFGTSYTLQGSALDNVSPVGLQVRVWAPNASGYSAWSKTSLLGTAKSKRWTYRLPMQNSTGQWLVQVRALDAAGNSSRVETASITRR